MYIPSFNRFEDQQEVLSFMQRFSFASVVTVIDGLPVAAHLPFLIKADGEQIVLRSHFAKANPQAPASIGQKVLVIFTEPHAYISPKHYEKFESVPTWNYLAVHAYGICNLIDREIDKEALLKETINFYDAAYKEQWDMLPEKFKHGMMNGITAFEIIVDDLQAKAKLSQNRSEVEQANIIASLGQSKDTAEKEIAAYMSRLNKH